MNQTQIAHYHLPGLFEFYELYAAFLPLYRAYPEYFYDWCDIASIYGAPADCIWGGGRVGGGDARPREVAALLREYGISARLTFSNSLLRAEHLADPRCNALCSLFGESTAPQNGVIVHADLLADYLRKNYPQLYLVSSTTKVLTDFSAFQQELQRPEFRFVVPDFRLNRAFDALAALPENLRGKAEFLCNECCWVGCRDRKVCFIGIDDIRGRYLPMGFSHFKIEGRGLGSAVALEFLLYYLTKPEYQLKVREKIYLDSMLDLF